VILMFLAHSLDSLLCAFFLLVLQVLEYRLNHKFKRQKDPSHRNYLSSDSYPLDELPPFALGNFYILSDNLGRYLYENMHRLKPVGTLEDLSVGFWLLSLGVSAVCNLYVPF
jgi:hypothetical protein